MSTHARSNSSRCSRSSTPPRRSPACTRSRTSRSSCTPARRTRWSARTAPESRRWSRSSAASTSPTRRAPAIGGEAVFLSGPAEARDRRASRSSTRSPRCSRICRSPRTCSSAASRCVAVGGSTTGRCTRPVNEIFERLGVRLDPDRIARGLSIAEQQLVEIAKALSHEAKVVIMDEPTAALSPVEVERLFGVVQTLRSHGTAVLFISHRLEEVFDDLPARDRPARRPARARRRSSRASRPDDLVRAMVGREVLAGAHEPTQPGRPRARG